MQFIRFAVLAVLAVLPLASGACILTIGDGTESASAPTTASASDSTTASASDSTTASASDSTTAGTSGAATDGTSGTATDGTSSSPTEAADSSTTAAATTEGSETGPVGGACGWVDDQNVYACGGIGEDPDGIIPIECAEPPVEGAPCDGDQGPIADPGCCSDGVNAYCYLGKLVVTICR